MKILHYSLGFPPYRTGGMTKFCIDLMQQQRLEGHEVALLWPGEMKLLNKNMKIKYCGRVADIVSFEVKNPLPISYDEGIIDIKAFTKEGEEDIYIILMNEWKPDVIHIHTLMGLHKAFIKAAKEKKVRLVFSAHDFFPICPKVTIFRHNQVCASIGNCSECPECNMTALAIWKGRILQHSFYRKLKNLSIVKKLRKRHRDVFLSGEISAIMESSNQPKNSANDYIRLRKYYQDLLKMMDCIHFNSSVTQHVYESLLGVFPAQTVAITHFDIKDNRRKKVFGDKLRLTYLGPQGEAKGFFS